MRVFKIKSDSIDDAFSELTATDTYNTAYNFVLQNGEIKGYYLIVDLHTQKTSFFQLNKTLDPVNGGIPLQAHMVD